MGLTIHYGLATDLTRTRDIRHVVHAMRQFALDVPFAEVGEIKEYRDGDAGFDQTADEGERWLKIQAEGRVEEGDYHYRVRPRHVVAFSTWPGEGCEPANVGLCRYPATIQVELRGRPRRLATGLTGWRWSSFCKTQYASDPDCGGVPHFLRCHLAVVKLLDLIRAGGLVRVEVHDEGDYWQKRDIEALAKEVGEWNEMVAGFASVLHQQAEGRGQAVEAPIRAFPNFEHLEAKGLEQWADLRRRLDEGHE
jgi:hypothetical protein